MAPVGGVAIDEEVPTPLVYIRRANKATTRGIAWARLISTTHVGGGGVTHGGGIDGSTPHPNGCRLEVGRATTA